MCSLRLCCRFAWERGSGEDRVSDTVSTTMAKPSPIQRDSQPPTVVSYEGRFQFLHALEECFPRMLDALHERVFTPHRFVWRRVLKGGCPTRQQLHNTSIAGRIRGLQKSMRALEEWSADYHVRDDWMFDAVLQTMRTWLSGDEQSLQWCYIARDLELRPFQPKLGAWLPVNAASDCLATSRRSFRRVATGQFKRALEDYLERTEAEWGTRRTSRGQLALHARWTALRHSGMTIPEIARMLPPRYGDPEQAVRRAIQRLRAAIGLTASPCTTAIPGLS